MKMIILDGGNKLIYKNKDKYTIKTSVGNFTDVNEAVKKVPSIIGSKNVKKCVWCGRFFINVGPGSHKRKTCSKNCSIEHRRQRNRNNLYNHRLFVKHQNQRVIEEYKKNKGRLPTGFNQIDTPQTMGEVILWDGIPKKPNGEYDWEKEHKIIKKLKRDLYKNNIVNP